MLHLMIVCPDIHDGQKSIWVAVDELACCPTQSVLTSVRMRKCLPASVQLQ